MGDRRKQKNNRSEKYSCEFVLLLTKTNLMASFLRWNFRGFVWAQWCQFSQRSFENNPFNVYISALLVRIQVISFPFIVVDTSIHTLHHYYHFMSFKLVYFRKIGEKKIYITVHSIVIQKIFFILKKQFDIYAWGSVSRILPATGALHRLYLFFLGTPNHS